MTDKAKPNRPKARVAKGFRDIPADEIRGLRAMLGKIQQVYESYGFEPVEQPFIEYTDALGKFLPDQDRPNSGVFSFQDDDDQWLSLRYDLTAPLARYVAENQQFLPTPYRSYRQGWVFRNEKPGPGRYRQFMQFDADTVGSASPAADAEVCMMAADTMEALGIPRGLYVLKVNNRKLLDGVLSQIDASASQKLGILRTIDKVDKFPIEEIAKLLGKGRKDESGAFIDGVGLTAEQSNIVLRYINWKNEAVILDPGATDPNDYSTISFQALRASKLSNETILNALELSFDSNPSTQTAIKELRELAVIVNAAGYSDCIKIDPSVVRGLEYYTGPVFECELLMPTPDENGNTVRFGSVGGGGRYDDLIARFTGQQVPATGFSIGVSRLYSALKLVGKAEESASLPPVVVLVMDKERQGDYWAMVQKLRAQNIRAEMYVGTAGMKAQMKYADKRGAPLVIIQGGDERNQNPPMVQIKDLRIGKELAAGIESREEYASQRLAQVSVPEAELVETVRKMLG